METSSSSKPADYKDTSLQEKDKLKSIFEEIVIITAVDFNSPEIQDIQNAVSEMLERIKAWINERGIFSISGLLLCGSSAEKAALWKYDYWAKNQPFIEFDFLAVLQATCDIRAGCQECFCVNTLPANLKLLEKRYCNLHKSYLNDGRLTKYIVKECFTRETNECLASCRCLDVKYQDQNWERYTFEPSPTCSKTHQGCDKCTVDRPTGTLRVKTSVWVGNLSENKCSLIFDWTSKAKTLCTRDSSCLPKTKKTDNLAIHIDFLPALELFQSKQQSADAAACSSSDLVLNPTSSEYKYICFLVPKQCVVRGKYGTWRRSGCQAEIDTIVNKMSDKHRKCYQVLKHLTGLILYEINTYHLKIAVLHHNSLCSDAGEDCAKCAFKVLDQLQHAYETKQLISFHSQANLLEKMRSDICTVVSEDISRLKEAICSVVSESVSVPSFLDKVSSKFTLLFDRYRNKQKVKSHLTF